MNVQQKIPTVLDDLTCRELVAISGSRS